MRYLEVPLSDIQWCLDDLLTIPQAWAELEVLAAQLDWNYHRHQGPALNYYRYYCYYYRTTYSIRCQGIQSAGSARANR